MFRAFWITATFAALVVASTSVTSTPSAKTPKPNAVNCPSPLLLNKESVAVGDQTVYIHTFSCAQTSTFEKREPLHTIERRVSAECTDPSICLCGNSCTIECNDSSDEAPKSADCAAISQAMAIVGTVNGVGQTFFLDPAQTVIFSSGSCQYEFDNIDSKEIEYCYDDWANIEGTIETDCIKGSDTGATCEAVNQFTITLSFV